MSKERPKKKLFKITKSWYIEASSIIDLKKDKLKTHRAEADEIKITQCRDW